MTKANNEVPGNSLASAEMMARQMERYGVALVRLYEAFCRAERYDIIITGLNLSCRTGPEQEWIGIVKAEIEGIPKVCFQAGMNPQDIIVALDGRFRNGRLDWRDDKFRPGGG